MITPAHSERRKRFRRSTRIAVRLLIALTLPSAATLSPAKAQSKLITTLIPTLVETDQVATSNETFTTGRNVVVLRFQAPALPAGAVVEKEMLQLTCSDMISRADATVTVKFSDQTTFGAVRFTVETPGTDMPALWITSERPPPLEVLVSNASFALKIESQPSRPVRSWYSISAAQSSFRPRLILEYTVTNRDPVVQNEGVPWIHSSRPFLPNPAGAEVSCQTVTAGDLWSYSPVFYKGLVYLVTKPESNYQLQALPPLGGRPLWSTSLTNAGQHLMLSESGRLYIVGKGILVYQLSLSDPTKPAMEATNSLGKPLSLSRADLNPGIAPAVGADGSLYFVNEQAVYGLNPDLQELWKINLQSKTTSAITIDPSGRFVYLVVEKEGVIAIDAQTGERLAFPEDAAGGVQSLLSKGAAFPAPVVIEHPDGTDKIYVAADGILACFNNTNTVPRTGGGESKRAMGYLSSVTNYNWANLKGSWSQPIVDQLPPGITNNQANTNKQIYAVRSQNGQRTLTAINWLTGITTNIASIGKDEGNLVIDQAGNVLVLNGTNLYVSRPGVSHVKLPFGASSCVTGQSRLLFGSEGTLYSADPKNAERRTLWSLVPQYTLSRKSSTNISSPTHLRVRGAADGNKAWTLSAAGNVMLGEEFSLKRGSALTVRILPSAKATNSPASEKN